MAASRAADLKYDYFATHSELLERLLGEAMHMLLEDEPRDPVTFLATYFGRMATGNQCGSNGTAEAAQTVVEWHERAVRAEERTQQAEERAQQAAERAQQAEERAQQAEAALHEHKLAMIERPVSHTLSTAEAAWAPFKELMSSQTAAEADAGGGDKLVMPAKYFLFGQTKAFMDGLPGMLEGGLLHSMAEEARQNEGGKWWAEFAYVVERAAEEDVADLPSTAKFEGKKSASGETIVRDRGHGGMTLVAFHAHEMARAADLSLAEVAAVRLYSGPMYAPINYALRTETIAEWATTIGCCYSAVLKLSFISQPARVYRGVREDEMQLPEDFLSRQEGKFAGGVERAFMSTTKSPAVALDYSVCAFTALAMHPTCTYK